MFLEQINQKLTFINMVIILIITIFIVELLEYTLFFVETGLIHFLALPYVLLMFIRIKIKSTLLDDFVLKKILKSYLFSLLILSSVHVFEFLMIKFSSINHSLIDFSVVLSYALWFLFIILINDFIIKTYTSQKKNAQPLQIMLKF